MMTSYLVVQNIDEVGIERMNVFQFWKLLQDLGQFLGEIRAGKLHFAHVKRADPGNFVMSVYNCRSFSLSFAKDNIGKVLSAGDHSYFLKIVVCHDSEINI